MFSFKYLNALEPTDSHIFNKLFVKELNMSLIA